MTKPIGNLIANIRAFDKVSGKTKARYGPQSGMAPAAGTSGAGPATEPSRRPAKFKKRKR
jgi:hypothetical protein